ncbi:MAG: hypothetical protein HUJ25_11030 [Crocinitomicaceae bacterium]|nr:hypothetical protein [Crocinitomicaceae bacterium]
MKILNSLILIIVCSVGYAYPTVKVDTLIDFTKADSAALKTELQLLDKILQNERFWEGIKNFEFHCTNWRRLHHYRKRNALYPKQKKDKHNYSNEEIYNLLWTGDDEIGSPKDSVINLKLQAKDYEQNKKGRTRHGGLDKNTLVISSNRKTRIHSGNPGEYACHLLHEYMHVLGFKHRKGRPSRTKKKCGGTDVALGVQLIAKDVLKKVLN